MFTVLPHVAGSRWLRSTLPLAVLLLVSLSGCFKYTEEIVFDEKGAGKLTLDYEQGNLGTGEKLFVGAVKKNPFTKENFSENLPLGVKLAEFKETTEGEQKKVHAVYEFDDIKKLASWKSEDKSDLIFHSLNMTHHDNAWLFSRTLKPRDADQLKNVKKFMTGAHITLKLTGPGRLIPEASNAMRVENDGHTCVWDGDFPTLLDGPNKDGSGTPFKAEYNTGLPPWALWAMIGGAALVLVLVAVIGGVAVMMMKKKKAA